MFGNTDIFLKNYVYDECDLYFQLTPKSFFKKLKATGLGPNIKVYATEGYTFTTPETHVQLDSTEFYDTVFYFKTLYTGSFANYTPPLFGDYFNFAFCTDMDLYFVLEVYKILTLLNFKAPAC
jgi:hypothetical protein